MSVKKMMSIMLTGCVDNVEGNFSGHNNFFYFNFFSKEFTIKIFFFLFTGNMRFNCETRVGSVHVECRKAQPHDEENSRWWVVSPPANVAQFHPLRAAPLSPYISCNYYTRQSCQAYPLGLHHYIQHSIHKASFNRLPPHLLPHPL